MREYAEAIVVAMLLAFAIRVFVVQAFKIPSGSMIPTLLIGDHILVSKLSYGLQWPTDCKFQVSFPPVSCYSSQTIVPFGSVQRGDIIVFRFPEDEDKDFIKRVIGLPGDRIEIKDGKVYRNGIALNEPYINGPMNEGTNYKPTTVPANSLYVMGDNRNNSKDSRMIGPVSLNEIVGRADVVVLPVKRMRLLPGDPVATADPKAPATTSLAH
jgi:signal peptidase I